MFEVNYVKSLSSSVQSGQDLMTLHLSDEDTAVSRER